MAEHKKENWSLLFWLLCWQAAVSLFGDIGRLPTKIRSWLQEQLRP